MRLLLQAVVISGGITTLQAVLHHPAPAVAKTPPARRAGNAPAARPFVSPQVRRARTVRHTAYATALIHRRGGNW